MAARCRKGAHCTKGNTFLEGVILQFILQVSELKDENNAFYKQILVELAKKKKSSLHVQTATR